MWLRINSRLLKAATLLAYAESYASKTIRSKAHMARRRCLLLCTRQLSSKREGVALSSAAGREKRAQTRESQTQLQACTYKDNPTHRPEKTNHREGKEGGEQQAPLARGRGEAPTAARTPKKDKKDRRATNFRVRA